MHNSRSRIFGLVVALLALGIFAGILTAAPATTLVWDQDFSVDDSGWFDDADNPGSGYGSITAVGGEAQVSGLAGGCPSYVPLPPTGPADCYYGPFSRFDGYRSLWLGDWKAEIDVYLDPAWPNKSGFDYSVATNNSGGSHQQDHIFHVGIVENYGSITTPELIVNASNNADFWSNPYKLTQNNSGNYYTVTSAGWYTLQHVFRDNAGQLEVDFNLLDSGANVLWSVTRAAPANTIATTGGNRYAWFTHVDVPGFLRVDNHQLFYNIPTVTPTGDTEVCDAGTVEIQVDDVEGLYGYEFIVDYDETLVTAVGNFDNSWFDPSIPANGFPGPSGWDADCTTVPGECRFAYTRGTQDPELATSTPQTIASINFTTNPPAAGGTFAVTVRDVKLTDKDSFEISGSVGGTLNVDVCGEATVSGKISLQGRPQPGRTVISEAPAFFTVQLTGGYGPYTGVVNAADGSYTITGVKYDVGGTNYTLSADHSVYLRAEKSLLVDGNKTGQNTKLLGGDANDDMTVDLLDLGCIGGQFGATGSGLTCTIAPTTPDVNDDFKVNIQDLSLAAGNYLLPEPQGW